MHAQLTLSNVQQIYWGGGRRLLMLRGQEARVLAGCLHSLPPPSVPHFPQQISLIHKLLPLSQAGRARTAAAFGLWGRWECEKNVCKLKLFPKHAPFLDFLYDHPEEATPRLPRVPRAFITRGMPATLVLHSPGMVALFDGRAQHQRLALKKRCCP